MKQSKAKSRDLVMVFFGIGTFYGVLFFLGITCPIKFLTGVSCPGCGMTRALLSALMFHFEDAWHFHPLFWLLPTGLLFYFFKKSKGVSKWLLFGCIALFLVVYLIRMFLCDSTIVVFEPSDGAIYRLFSIIWGIFYCPS